MPRDIVPLSFNGFRFDFHVGLFLNSLSFYRKRNANKLMGRFVSTKFVFFGKIQNLVAFNAAYRVR